MVLFIGLFVFNTFVSTYFQYFLSFSASFLVMWITAPCFGEEKLVAFITPSLKRPRSLKFTKSVVSLKPKL